MGNLFFSFLQQMFFLYVISFIGFIAQRKKIFPPQAMQAFTALILNITLPALIIYSLNIELSLTLVQHFLLLLILSFLSMNSAIILALLMRKRATLKENEKSVFEGLTIFGNQGFIGYAVIYILFQETGVIYLTIFNIYYLILIWTYGIYLFTKSKEKIDWKKIFLNPGFLSTIIGVLLLCSPFQLPSALSASLESVGKMTIPLSMIVIGSLIADIRLKELLSFMKNRYIWKSAFVKLLLIPFLLLPLAIFPLSFPLFATAVIASGMPSAPTISLYAHRFNANHSFASVGVAITTILCIITIPFLYFIVLRIYT